MRGAVATLLVGAVLSGCTAGGPTATPTSAVTVTEPAAPSPPAPSATASPPASSPSPPASPSPVAVDVAVVPDEVSPAYVDAVADELLGRVSDVYGEILARPVDPQALTSAEQAARLDAVADGQYLLRRVEEAQALARGTDGARRPLLPAARFGRLTFATEQVVVVQERCVVAVGRVDASGTAVDGGPSEDLRALSLTPARGEPQLGATNPTPWEVLDILPNYGPDGTPNDDDLMLGSTLADFGDALDTTCDEEP